jgi:hypothetical protein
LLRPCLYYSGAFILSAILPATADLRSLDPSSCYCGSFVPSASFRCYRSHLRLLRPCLYYSGAFFLLTILPATADLRSLDPYCCYGGSSFRQPASAATGATAGCCDAACTTAELLFFRPFFLPRRIFVPWTRFAATAHFRSVSQFPLTPGGHPRLLRPRPLIQRTFGLAARMLGGRGLLGVTAALPPPQRTAFVSHRASPYSGPFVAITPLPPPPRTARVIPPRATACDAPPSGRQPARRAAEHRAGAGLARAVAATVWTTQTRERRARGCGAHASGRGRVAASLAGPGRHYPQCYSDLSRAMPGGRRCQVCPAVLPLLPVYGSTATCWRNSSGWNWRRRMLLATPRSSCGGRGLSPESSRTSGTGSGRSGG